MLVLFRLENKTSFTQTKLKSEISGFAASTRMRVKVTLFPITIRFRYLSTYFLTDIERCDGSKPHFLLIP